MKDLPIQEMSPLEGDPFKGHCDHNCQLLIELDPKTLEDLQIMQSFL